MKKITIRVAGLDDVKGLVELCELHAIYEKSDYVSDGKEEALKQHLFGEQPALFCLVATEEEELVGYATFMKQFSTWDAGFYIYMDCLFLKKAARGFGIGEKLVDKIKEEGKKMGCNLVQWQTPDFNKRAMKFYERIGASAKSKERYFLEIG